MLASESARTNIHQRFFTIVEAALILKVSADTVRRMVKRGQLRCVVITERTRRIPLEALNELAQKGLNDGTAW
ncbi:MAG: helix-turn-helix domain-containing protein [Ktedonobacteraceae bacterium]|nr:helix-turn-helix domain-containing protein [Ktedonobacteraceae bacterium]MBA3826545.1 helix-turn-helix domain-containing protein [Ktedonobacterales bacterium]